MVVSLRKDNTPEPTIIRMLDNSGMLKVTFSDVMTCDQFFLTPENFHPAGEYLLHKAERMIEIRERKKKTVTGYPIKTGELLVTRSSTSTQYTMLSMTDIPCFPGIKRLGPTQECRNPPAFIIANHIPCFF